MGVERIAVVAWALACAAAAGGAGGAPPELRGHWAGWAYADGQDFPLRLDSAGDGGAPMRLWSPAAASLEMVVESAERAGGVWSLAGATARGTPFRFEGEAGDGVFCGTGSIGEGLRFEFELLRAARELGPAPGGGASAYAGSFVGGGVASLPGWAVVRERAWGEVVIDIGGARRTLFPIGEDAFYVGPAVYDPSEVAALVTFERDASGGVGALTLERGGASTRLVRGEFREGAIAFEADGVTLRGCVVFPAGEGPFPGVVVVGGSDWETRDDVREIGRRFAAMGVAALIHDRRGHGESGGGRLEWLAQSARDAAGGGAALRATPGVDPRRVGYFGASRGGWVAPLASTMDGSAAFLVVFVAPATTPEAQERARRLALLREETDDPAELALAERYLAAQFGYGATGEGWDEYMRLRDAVGARGWLEALLGPEDPFDPAWAWTRLNMRYDPAPTIRRLTCPTLVVLGGADRAVPAAPNEALWRAALETAPADAWRVVVAPHADHALVVTERDGRPVRIHSAVGASEMSWPLVGRWLRERAGGSE